MITGVKMLVKITIFTKKRQKGLFFDIYGCFAEPRAGVQTRRSIPNARKMYILKPRRGLGVISTVKMVQIVIFTPKIANFWRFWLIIAIFRK